MALAAKSTEDELSFMRGKRGLNGWGFRREKWANNSTNGIKSATFPYE
jgi:hypothetical protein